ncbi:MAG: response regulator, partial [Candidatus Hydrogenedentes bacterium]|nr:response regulator [Candidatus Hydrogenedentota bacterium]
HVVGRLVCDDANQPYCTIANILDITDRKRIEDALRDSEQRFKTMADTAPSMLWVTDENLNCTFLSRGWFDYTGQTEAEGYGTGWTQAVHPDDRPDAYEAFVAAASRREPFSVDYRLRRYDGTYRWAIDAGRPRLSEAGDLIGYIGSVTDAHQRKEAEEALQRANDELEVRVQDRTKELQRRAMQLSRLTSELTLTEQRERRRIAQVLHDHLQQLLVAASLRLGVLGRSASDRQKQSVEELSELLEEAIRASRSLTVELAPPILHEAGLSAGLKWLARWMQEKHGLVVHVQTDEEATGEPEDVRILLFHSVRELLFNVVKHAGSPIATVDLRIVKKRYLQVTVADQGEGFDPLRIFSEEQRSASGFGLFSIRERLSMLGGRLEIANDPEGGSVITMMAPIQPVHSAAPQKLDRSGAAGRAGERVARRRRQTDSARIRILLVDDHEVMRQGVRAILMDEPDMEVAGEASNGVEAIEQAHLIQPDVVLMDFSMPEMNGLEATRRIAAELPHVKIIGLSMYEEHEQAAAMLNAGASDYRTKSGNMEQLLDTIRNVYQAAEGKPSGQ